MLYFRGSITDPLFWWFQYQFWKYRLFRSCPWCYRQIQSDRHPRLFSGWLDRLYKSCSSSAVLLRCWWWFCAFPLLTSAPFEFIMVGKRDATAATVTAQPQRDLESVDMAASYCVGGGYFFALSTPKITTANRFSNAKISNSVMLSPPFRFRWRSSRFPLAWPYPSTYPWSMSSPFLKFFWKYFASPLRHGLEGAFLVIGI